MRAGRNSRTVTIVLALLIVGGIALSLYAYALLGPARQSSSSVSSSIVPMLWESTNFNMSNGETPVQAATQFNANFIFRGTFQWGMTGVKAGPESSTLLFIKTSNGIRLLKQYNPHLLFEGGYGTQYLSNDAAWPNGTALSRADFAAMVGKNSTGGWVPELGYDGYIPDLASPTYQKFVLQWSERQIDEGVDGMFFDDPYDYAAYLVSVEHQDPATVYDQYAGYMSGLVQSLKSYASAHGRTFFATINSGWCDRIQEQTQYPALISFESYFTCSADLKDFDAGANPALQPIENFSQIKATITRAVNIPIMVFVDWPDQQNALLNLTAQQQIQVLTNLDLQLKANGLLFVYHVFHRIPMYDSVAEGTYSTLLQMAKDASAK